MSGFNYILLDWDGCLAKTLDLWLSVYKEVAKEEGIDLSYLSDREIVERSFGKWADGLKALGIKNAAKAYKKASEEVIRRSEKVELYEGARELLKGLGRKDKLLALITSSYRQMIEKPLTYHNLEGYFKVIITREDVVKGKPDPEIVYKAINTLGGEKENYMIIGDSDHDIKAGKNAKVTTVLFYPKENEKFYRREFLEKEKPDYTIDKLVDLISLI